MNINDLWEQPIKSSGENGIFRKQDWIKEADGKLISAELLRDCAIQKSHELESIKKICDKNGVRAASSDIIKIIDIKCSANKSSILLLGYAIELLLKAGIVSLLISAPKHLLERKVKDYSHKLLNIADDLQLTLSVKERALLTSLSSYIIQETRYPLTPKSTDDYCNRSNLITLFVSDNEKFLCGVNLFHRLRKFMIDIDGTPDNPKFHSRMGMEQNGYVIFRAGGTLPPIIIIKFCDSQINSDLNTLSHVRYLLSQKNKDDMSIHSRLMEKAWVRAIFYLVDKKKGLIKIDVKP
ncbi:hypothetical protein [Aeromonas rivipollensis]|uniref:Uncharacterized protein n=1 Tax=Aeromonas rivipollensis TaxID=948519 RepID=A0AAW9YGU9_9GAMM|nr:hypothetical protein [Aeromonas rivipollensis]NEX77118.1 hypothetical protein [Aeromonas rivipollensis]